MLHVIEWVLFEDLNRTIVVSELFQAVWWSDQIGFEILSWQVCVRTIRALNQWKEQRLLWKVL